MTSLPWLNWLQLALSLFCVLHLTWLGVTIALNASRKRWGVYVAALTVILAALFFCAHALIVSSRVDLSRIDLRPWWVGGWLLVTVLPFAWYGLCLWFAGDIFSSARYERTRLRALYLIVPRRPLETLFFALVLALSAACVVLFAGMTPLPPDAGNRTVAELLPRPALFGAPLFAWLYAINTPLCIAMSLYALRGSSETAGAGTQDGATTYAAAALRQARRRARPWLLVTALALQTIAVLAAVFLLITVHDSGRWPLALLYSVFTDELGAIDAVIMTLIVIGVVALGRGVVAYEIFSERYLTRGELLRQWRNVTIVAAGSSALVAFGVAILDAPRIAILAVTLLTGAFYAALSWRTNVLRDQHVQRLLRVSSDRRLFEALTEDGAGMASINASFGALAGDVLRARQAYLTPVGDLAALLETTLRFPEQGAAPTPGALDFEPGTICLPIDPALHNGARWAVPLWGQRGLSGVLMLGDAIGDAGYTQEQFEIARAQGERLLDTWAMRALTLRLLALQRRRMAESGVADRRFRRVIHDDALPRVHAALLNATDEASVNALSTVHRELSALLKELPSYSESLAGRSLFDALRDLHARELAREFDRTEWRVTPEAERAGAQLSDASAEVAFYAAREAMRNAARYGRGEDGVRRALTLTVCAERAGRELVISIIDDGAGLVVPRALQPGRGNGLALHSTLMIVMGGSLSITPGPERGVVVRLSIPAID